MNGETLRVGIIGADAKASWAKVSHVPAIQGLAGFELAGVATRHENSAREAAEVFGARKWFSDPYALIHDDQIDLVTIAVKVPDHRDLVLAALGAGKHVYCESPLGSSLAQAEELAAAAGSRHAAIGLQSRLNPAVRRAAKLIADGAIGRLLSARVVSTSSGFGPVTATPFLYFEQASSGASLLTITAGHTLDLVEAVLGTMTEVEARTDILWPSPQVVDSGETTRREVPDHIEVIGITDKNVVISASILGGIAPEQARFELEVRGSEGWLTLSGGHPYGVQAGNLTLTSSVAFDPPEAPVVTGGLLDAATNVGEVYASLARDIREATYNTAGFQHALHNTRLTDAVLRAGKTRQRQSVANG